MKGPGLKIGNDVRRLWRCPTSGKELLVDGNVTSVRSPFVNDLTWMKLVEVHRVQRETVPVEKFHHLEEVDADTVFEGETPPAEKSESPVEEAASSEDATSATEETSTDKTDVEPSAESEQVATEAEKKEPEDSFGDGLDTEEDTKEGS